MRFASHSTKVTLFPFLSVLLCTVGILAFLSISFLLVIPINSSSRSIPKNIQFEWVGTPAFVKPIFIRCYTDRVEYYNFFDNKEYTVFLDELLEQLEGENPELLLYLVQLLNMNTNIKKQFGKTEYYPLLLVYPDGVLTSELMIIIIKKIGGLNFGLEPMLSNWDIPYQGFSPKR